MEFEPALVLASEPDPETGRLADLAEPEGKKGSDIHHPNSPWTEEKVALLVKLHAEKLSATECAALLGVTRNAVIGRWHRMGLKSDKPVGGRTVIKVPKAKGATILRFRAKPEAFRPRDASVVPLNLELVDLEAHHCRFPYGTGPYTFCGRHKQEGSSYCSEHFQLTWEPSRRRA